ncbi:MAG TPA: TlpA family protein disulfide reductase [Candidatus Coprenecus pullistercoris]|nr:TlpA family protein disulfide reductase [Candidatus Coprenecus pullistercoris]
MNIRTLIIYAYTIILSLQMSATDLRGQSDTTARQLTQEDINMVMSVFDGMQPSEIISRADGFIMTGKTEEETARTAYYVYRYYRQSRIMGYDEIAIYIADNYFLNGRYRLDDQDALLEMRLFADTNRQSLIGLKAPDLSLQDPAGNTFTIHGGDQDYTVLYFYDDDCASCIRTTPGLMQYLARGTDGLNFTVYMIYTQSDRERWLEYIAGSILPFRLPDNITLVNLWDPDMTSGFVTKYGVISTPKLFLLDARGTIIGRELTPTALAQTVEVHENAPTSADLLFDSVFSSLEYSSDTTGVTEIIDAFFEDSKDNPDFFHELFFTLYQYLKNSGSYNLQQGAAYLADKYIVHMPRMWESVKFIDKGETSGSSIRADFESVNEFLDQTELAVTMFYRNPLDKPVSDLVLYTPDNKKTSIYDVSARYTVLYFYTLDCAVCGAVTPEMKKIQDTYGPEGVQVLAIYTGTDRQWKKYIKENGFGWTDLWDRKRKSGMFDKYDLLDVPAIYLLDKDKNTLAKDINPEVLGALLEYYLND